MKKRRSLLAAPLVAAMLVLAGLALLWGMGQAQAPGAPEETTVLCDTDDAQLGAWAWLGTYLGQFQQDFLPEEERLADWGVEYIHVSEQASAPVATLTFWVRPADPLCEDFLYWGVLEDGEIRCEWTVQFLVSREAGGYRFSYGGVRDGEPAASAPPPAQGART